MRGVRGGFGFGQWEEGAQKADAFFWHSRFRITQVPAGVGSERDFELREADAAEVVAIGVDLRNEDREWLSDGGRLFGDNAVFPLRPEVEMKRLMNPLGDCDAWEMGKLQLVAPNECFI